MVILFFFQQFCPKKAWKGITLNYYVSIQPFTKQLLFSGGKNFGYVNVACNFGNLGLVWPCFVILGMIMIGVAYLTLSRPRGFPLTSIKSSGVQVRQSKIYKCPERSFGS